MARRQLLTDEQWARLLAPPSDEREIVRCWTLSREDFDIIFRKRSDHSRLGFALLLCYLRYPGRVLGAAGSAGFIRCAAARCQPSGVHQGTAGGIKLGGNNLPNLWNGSAIGASTGPVFFITWRGLPQSPRTSKGRISWLRCCWKICAVIGSLSLRGGCWN